MHVCTLTFLVPSSAGLVGTAHDGLGQRADSRTADTASATRARRAREPARLARQGRPERRPDGDASREGATARSTARLHRGSSWRRQTAGVVRVGVRSISSDGRGGRRSRRRPLRSRRSCSVGSCSRRPVQSVEGLRLFDDARYIGRGQRR